MTEERDKLALPEEECVDDIIDDVLTLEPEAEVIAEERVDDDVEFADDRAEDALEGLFESPGREGSHGANFSRFLTVRSHTNCNRKGERKDKAPKSKFKNHDDQGYEILFSLY